MKVNSIKANPDSRDRPHEWLVWSKITITVDNRKMLISENQQPGMKGVDFYHEAGWLFYDSKLQTSKYKKAKLSNLAF